MALSRERGFLWAFDLALIAKALGGISDIAGGALVLFIRPEFVVRVAEFVTAGELAADPGDPVALWLRAAAHSFSVHTHYFIAGYLMVHGLVKLTLVIAIFAGVRIAYPLFMFALGVFGAYEAYRGIFTGNIPLLAFMLFDLLLLALTLHEYRLRRGALMPLLTSELHSSSG